MTDLMGDQTQGRGRLIHAVIAAAGHCIAPAKATKRERDREKAEKDKRESVREREKKKISD